MTASPDGYHLVLPAPWVRIPVNARSREHVETIVDRQFADAPAEVPPDQLLPAKRMLVERFMTSVQRAAAAGALDLYAPLGPVGDVVVGASFAVSQVRLTGPYGDDQDYSANILGGLVEDGGEIVALDNTLWVRSDRVRQPSPEAPEMDVPVCDVTYTAAVPGDSLSWVLVSFTGTGDGDPTSAPSRLVVELFDAIMGTWRWSYPPSLRRDTDDPAEASGR